ncbi:protein phosphatase, partial [Haematococcus lacustris]
MVDLDAEDNRYLAMRFPDIQPPAAVLFRDRLMYEYSGSVVAKDAVQQVKAFYQSDYAQQSDIEKAQEGKWVKIALGVAMLAVAEIGVDAGAYARQLMGFAKELADQLTAPGCAEYDKLCSNMTKPPQDAAEVKNSTANMLQQTILEKAHAQVDVRGSSTASLLVLAGDRVLASNLGDSGFLVLRNGQVIFHSPQQQHDFNFPFQIGSSDSMSDMPASAQKFELAVQAGDVVVMGTDGLWDNCFDEEIMSVIRYCQDVNMPLDKTAQVLAHYARHRASDPKFASPFAYAAFQAGFAYMGGKMDDITVVVARVAHALEVADNPLPGQGGQDLTMPHLASKL